MDPSLRYHKIGAPKPVKAKNLSSALDASLRNLERANEVREAAGKPPWSETRFVQGLRERLAAKEAKTA